MKYLFPIILFVFLAGLPSCEENNEITPAPGNGGIAITFDDRHITEWTLADSLLTDYQWKATFYVPYFDRLTEIEIQHLHELNTAGHEIAGHGLNHENAVAFISSEGVDKYLHAEILPMIELMENEGFSIESFAYPFGLRNQDTDHVLLQYFDIVRGVNRGIFKNIAEHDCFFENSPVVYSRGIDRQDYPYLDDRGYEQYIMALIASAKDNNKILIVHCHTPVENLTGDHQVSISTLARICEFIEANNMTYYTVSDLTPIIHK
jgi:peptidoglycan/xylan/chitin deacetylase (PgdA/CDA1 family)